MILTFEEKNLKMVFEVTEDKNLYLLEFSNSQNCDIDDEIKKYFPAIELQISGENQNDHHGSKHTVTSASVSLKYVKHNYYKNEIGNKLEFLLKNKSVSVVLNYQFYDNISVVRSWNEVKNISDAPVGLEYISSFTLTGIDNPISDDEIYVYIPHNSWVREGAWEKKSLPELGFNKITKFSTKKISVSNTGTWSSKEYLPMGAFENSKTTFMWQIEHNGSWQWEISDIADRMYLKISGPNEYENHWYKNLKPNETFESVKTAVAVSKGFDFALEEMTHYRRKITRENRSDKKLPVIFNDYMNCLWAEPTTEKMIPVIDKACEAGAEYYCMDAGWYADGTWWETVGEWKPCEWRFPNGIKEVFDYIKSKNMVPGIWLEIEVMGINCPILNQFTDDCFFVRHGKRVIDHGRYHLDFRNEKVREFAASVIDRVVNEYGVGYIKMDYNIDGGIGTEINSDSYGDGLLQHNRAFLNWIDTILDKYPDLILENCGSGGLRMDYAMLSRYALQSVTDQEGYVNNGIIASNCAIGVLPEQAAIWSYPKADGDENEAEYNMVNSLLCRMHLSGEVFNLTEKQFGYVKEGVEFYKSIRNKISGFIPFYPLGINSFTKNIACVGYKWKNEIYLSVWKTDEKFEDIFIPVKCKFAEIVYPSNINASVSCSRDGITLSSLWKNQAVVIKCTVK